ncbi:hypothetical protein F4777DRAFT_217909 [Nemania sp. FL0916]|nr:hypothetical protein F4777DRAFT_217909 [Nemania sp. FL0916]
MDLYLQSIDTNRDTLQRFVADFYRHGGVNTASLSWPVVNCHKTQFDVCDDAFEPSIPQEIRGPFMDAYRLLARMPLMPEMTDPTFTRVLQTWVEHVFEGSMNQSWNTCWTAHVIVHFYRRITPPEYQSRAHMQIVYAVAAAFDLATTSTIFVDDRLDGHDARGGLPAWHTGHPITFPTDTSVLTAMGKRTLRFLVPDSHPFKRQILDLYDDYQDYCLSYLSVTGARLQKAPDERIRLHLYYPVDQVTPELYRAFSWMRSGYYNTALRDACRLLACYSDITATKDRQQLYIDVIARGNAVLCVLDDIRDSRALAIRQHIANPRGMLGEYLAYVTKEMASDFFAGETHQTFLMAALDLARGESTAMSLSQDERAEIMTTLRECYWPREQGLEEAPANKESRIRHLTAMFLKYDLFRYLKEHVLTRTLEEYFLTSRRAVEVLKIPSDMLSYPLGAMLCEETDTRPDHLAAAIREIMIASGRETTEEEKLRRMSDLIQHL